VLDASCFVQVNSGSTGSGGVVTSMTPTLPTATTAGNGIILISGCVTSTSSTFADDGVFRPVVAVLALNGPGSETDVRDTPGGETSFSIAVTPSADIGYWWVAEVTNVASLGTFVDPFFNTKIIGIDYGAPGGTGAGCATSFQVTSSATTCDTTGGGADTTANGDDLIIAVGVTKVASGAVPALTSFNDVTGGQPGTWTQIGSRAVTTRAAGANVAADVFYRVSGGTDDVAFDGRFTWASSTPARCATLAVFQSNEVNPQETRGRAATNSTM
jgi:hypothetical protein